jgi:hypothetical protein
MSMQKEEIKRIPAQVQNVFAILAGLLTIQKV